MNDDVIQPWKIVKAAILGFLFITLFTRFVSMVFVLNFTTGGVNATLAFTLLPHSAIAIALTWKGTPFSRKTIKTLWISFLLAAGLSLIPNAVIAALLSAIALNLSGLIFIHEVNFENKESRLGILGALLLNYLIYSILGHTYVFGTFFGMAIFVAVLIIGGVTIFVEDETEPSLASFPFVYAFLFLNMAFLGSPSLIATWSMDSWIAQMLNPDIYLFFVNLGCLAGAFLALLFSEKVKDVPFPYLEGIFLFSFLDILLNGFLTLVTIPITIFLTSSFVLQVPIPQTTGSLKELSFIQGSSFIFLFLYVAAGNWAFMPSIFESVSRGLAWLHLFFIGALFAGITSSRRNKK